MLGVRRERKEAKMIPVLIESPYAGKIHRNRAYLWLCIRDCFARGEAGFASHQMYVDALDDIVPEERDQGIEAGLVWGAFAHRSVVYIDFPISTGMKYGIKNAETAGRPIEYRALPNFDPDEFYTEFDDDTDTPDVELFKRHMARLKGPAHGACVIVVKQVGGNPYVLGLDGPKGIGLPGGKIEPGETPEQAAARELKEETGLDAAPFELRALDVRETDNLDIAHGFLISAKYTQGKLKESKEGRPVWLKPIDLVKNREGFPPVRFPKYNAWALKELGLLGVDDV
jgi:8-oxo-dGTP pyrophosphatase MutT (NUDIX family)